MLLFVFLSRLLSLVNSVIDNEYRFGVTFGQVLRDFSTNKYHAVNGASSSVDANDVKMTDRGAYFSGMSEQITLPPNDKNPGFNLGSTYSIAFWFNPDCDNCLLFSRSKDVNSFFYYALKPSLKLSAYYRFKSIDTGERVSSGGYYSLRQWTLVTVGHSIFTCSISIMDSCSVLSTIRISINTGITTYGESGTFSMFIGKAGFGYPSFKGYVWRLRIDDTLNFNTDYCVGSSSTCLTGTGCSGSCSPAVEDSYSGNGCLSEQFDPLLTENGGSCPSACPSGPCKGSVCLECLCDFGTCQVVAGESLCFCPTGLIATVTSCICGGNSFYNGDLCISCEISCLTCSQQNTCLTCKDPNALPDYASFVGCKCNEGFYGTRPLSTSTSCSPCLPECLGCADGTTCFSCKALYAQLVSGRCKCLPGYGGVDNLDNVNSCVPCYFECKTCFQMLKCETCIDSNSSPKELQGCSCNDGFYNIFALNFDGACFPCHSHCKTCAQDAKCLTCKDPNASPAQSIGCICNQKFYLTGDLSTVSACSACHVDCLTCVEPGLCLTCIADFSIPDVNGCECDVGYFQTLAMSNKNACSSCLFDCYNCSNQSSCDFCKARNTEILAGRCQCKFGYFEAKSLENFDACVECYSDCETCDNLSSCLTCKDPNSITNNFIGCDCKTGFWRDLHLTSSPYCKPCHPNCISCKKQDICLECIDKNSLPSFSGCECLPGFFNKTTLTTLESCLECNSQCLTCFNENYFHCKSCSEYLLISLCTKRCPVGFYEENHKCLTKNQGKPSVWFKFKEIGKFFDSVSGLTAQGVNSGKRDLKEASLTSAYLRGVYLAGGAFLKVGKTDKRPIFSPRFTISTWIHPETTSFDLFEKKENDVFLNIFIERLKVFCKIKINGQVFTLQSPDAVKKDEWNHLSLILSYTDLSCLMFKLNGVDSQLFSLIEDPFFDVISENNYLGSGSFSRPYQGFIYEFIVFIGRPEIDNFNLKDCESCSICPLSNTCIPICKINEYFNETTGICFDCNAECNSGCVRSNSCNLCNDFNCLKCSSFNENSCFECRDFYEVINGNCFPCEKGRFYDHNKKKCKNCSGLCKSCSSKLTCLSCKPNSFLHKDNSCKCILGYSGTTKCTRNTFSLEISVKSNNTLKLVFTEPVKVSLTKEILEIFISGSLANYSYSPKSKTTYLVTLTSPKTIERDSLIILLFSNKTKSSLNSLLRPIRYSFKLFKNDEASRKKQLEYEINEAKKLAFTGTSLGLITITGFSILGWDPSSLFNFISTAELFYSFYLFEVETYPVLEEFLLGMRIHSRVPNLFSYFITTAEGVELPPRLIKYGFDCNISFLNAGIQLTVLIFYFVAFLVVCIVRCFKKKLTEKIWVKFQFGIFLRFWIQSNLEILLAVVIGIEFSQSHGIAQGFDLSFAVVFIGFEVAGLVTILRVIFVRRGLDDDDSVKRLEGKFPALFEEFHARGLSDWFFYINYLFRRAIIGVLVALKLHPVLKIIIATTLSLFVLFIQHLFYIIFSRCYKESLKNIYHILNELHIFSFFLIILLKHLQKLKKDWKFLSDMLINLMISAWSLNIFFSLLMTLLNLHIKIKTFLRNRKLNQVEPSPEQKPTQPSFPIHSLNQTSNPHKPIIKPS